MIDLCFTLKLVNLFGKRACKLNINKQNSYFHVKIGLWILTTKFMKQPHLNQQKTSYSVVLNRMFLRLMMNYKLFLKCDMSPDLKFYIDVRCT